MTEITLTAHAVRTISAKGISPQTVREVWESPDVTYPSHRHPGQHKRVGKGLCLACDDQTGRIITVFVDRVETDLRPDQRRDADAVAWARKSGKRVR
jgi:hypothetical protein